MRTRTLMLAMLLCLPLCIMAEDKESGSADKPKSKSSTKVFTGISGGLSIHGGYLFSKNPQELFSNTGLGDRKTWENLKRDGFCYGFGAQLRIHLIDHIHVGAEAHMSNLPLMKSGSNVSSAWAGGFADFYGGWGKATPLIGLGVGGGQLKRLYVPDADVVSQDTTSYNSAYTKTPFFYLNPYIGIEFPIGSIIGMQFRIDYMLQFGSPGSSLADATKSVDWSHFLTPSGPRLHVILLFGKMKR